MRRRSAWLTVSLWLFAAPAIASDQMNGTIKEIDQKANTIKFARDGGSGDEVLAVDKAVDLKSVKANAKAQITVDGGVVKEIKPERRRSTAGY